MSASRLRRNELNWRGQIGGSGLGRTLDDAAKVLVMARGKKPPDPLLESSDDLLQLIPFLADLTRDDTIVERDAAILEWQRKAQALKLTIIYWADVAELAVEQHAKSIRKGEVSDFRKRARKFMEGAKYEHGFAEGNRDLLNRLLERKLISPKQFRRELQCVENQETEKQRFMLIGIELFLREIRNYVIRGKRRGRPRMESGHSQQQLKDGSLFHEAVMAAGGYASIDRDRVATSIPDVVRRALEDGRLSRLGQTRQEAVDRHSKRIRNLLDNLPDLR